MATKPKKDHRKLREDAGNPDAAPKQNPKRNAAQLLAVNKELEALSYSISHDLRAPLRSINAFSQLLQEEYQDKLDDQGKEYLRIVVESSNHMAKMIEGLLQLSRVNRGEICRQPVDMSALAAQILNGLQQLEPHRKVDVIIAPNLKVTGDERLLRMALENLLKNAWTFSSKKAEGRIEFGVERQAGNPFFFVRDNGAGFDGTYANKLFGAFQRLHSTSEFPGQGIGLAMVQRIISRHGGRVWAEAEIDKGAIFYFTLS